MLKPIYLIVIAFSVFANSAKSQDTIKSNYIHAYELTIAGKALTTPEPYHRADTSLYPEMTALENNQARCATGLTVLFKTNSPYIQLVPEYVWEFKRDIVSGMSVAGFDLYIKKNGKWVYANSVVPAARKGVLNLITNMDTTTKECLLYLPMYSELQSLKIGVAKSATLLPIPNPFTIKTVFWGSSFTHGVSASRTAMTYPAQIQRMLNLDVLNLAFSGNALLQPYFSRLLGTTSPDAIVLDAFSNPDSARISKHLVNFVDYLANKHKNIPLIFVETIHRGNANFNNEIRESERKKREAAQAIMKELLAKYKNVHFVPSPLPESLTGDTSADGVHPSDLGYYYWAQNLSVHLKRILKIDSIN